MVPKYSAELPGGSILNGPGDGIALVASKPQ